MDLKIIKDELVKYSDLQEVNNYIAYLFALKNDKNRDGQLKNKWVEKVGDGSYIQVFKKVSKEGLNIDGDMVTLQFRGKLLVSYNYQAYKNKVLLIYPETLFDVQTVSNLDTFSFRKNNGKVLYNHEFGDPFNTEKDIIGAYCIIKNKRGEFIEILNLEDISKMRNVAKTQYIWNEWFGEMVIKSVTKRACKRHFKDLVGEIDEIDNDNYELENVSVDHEMQTKINNCETVEELQDLYDLIKDDIKDEVIFLKLMKERELEIEKS